MQVRYQLEPEGDFGRTVVVSDAWLQADVQVQLFLRGVLGPGYFLKTIRLGVDELGILRNRLVWVTEKSETKSAIYSQRSGLRAVVVVM